MRRLKELKQEDFPLKLLKDLGMCMLTENTKKAKRLAVWECICGKQFKAQPTAVKKGYTRSCGCLQVKRAKEVNTTHGKTRSSEYSTWSEMKARCTRKSHKNYPHYGGRGIKVCEEWTNSFDQFLLDMGERPPGLELDRKDNNEDYTPSNCRWTDRETQRRNSRASNKLGYKGISSFNTKKDGTGKTRYRATIMVNSSKITIGYYDTAEEAAKAYDNYIILNNLEGVLNDV